MKEQKKKRLIALLLFISCLISGYMFFISSDSGAQRLTSFAEADSLIRDGLTDFNIGEKQVRVTSTRVDSNLTRKTYHVSVPYGFSKTQLHAELNSRLHDFGIETPAKVSFPEKDIRIHLLYNGTVIRSLSIQTDPDLVLNRNRASILVTFDYLPDEELIDQLASLGEPFPIVLKVENPLEASNLKKKLTDRYSRVLFWLQNKNNEDLIKTNPSEAIAKLKQMENVLPEAMMLQFASTGQTNTEPKLAAKTNLAFVDAGNALMLHEGMGKAAFFEELNKLTSNRIHPIVVITGNETTLSWLAEKLPQLKKAGVEFVPPPKSNF